MKVSKSTIIAFLVGVVIASLGWLGHLCWYQFQVTTAVLLGTENDSRGGQRILEYLDDPSPSNTARVVYLATNLVSSLPDAVDYFADEYPYLPIKKYWKSHADYFKDYLEERKSTEQNL
ncbi:hypothetical protein BVX97_04950 [bacterium E08(2017)]|nr:hypothetical protein BVX97_04950 [bacterium E08(2017)]